MGQKLGVCLIGAGRAGMIHGRNFASLVPGARLTAVSDTNEKAARAAAVELDVDCWYSDYRQALQNPEIDAVIIATPTKFHHTIVLQAAQSGKHVLCEKPMAMTGEECQEMIDVAEKNNVKLQVGFMRRFDASFRRAYEIIRAGTIGDVVMVKSLTRGPSKPRAWMYDIGISNGPLAEVNSHDIDTLRWMTGSEVESLYAIAGNFRCAEAREEHPDFYDTVLLSIRMKNGALGCIDGAQGVQYGYDARVDVLGTKGCITVGGMQEKTTLAYTGEGIMVGDSVKSWTILFRDAYLNEDISFISCIKNDTKPEADGYDGLKAVSVVEAGNESIKSGNVVHLSDWR